MRGKNMKLRIQKTHPSARVPEYMTEGAAAFDLYAATVNGMEHVGDLVYPGHPVVCDTGLAFEVPDGYALRVASRSVLAFREGVTAFPGVIDSDYRGSVKVLLTCAYLDDDAPPVKINPGDRIAQAMLVPLPRVEFEVCEQLTLTERGDGGFGSTGGAA
jgi:dUTP pyrophosphatase